MKTIVKKASTTLFAFLLLFGVCFSQPVNTYAAHKHDKQVQIVSATERNGYIDVKWKKDKSCKSYCVHLQCGSKVLYNHCVGKTQNHYKIKVTKTLGKNLDKCSNWKAVVYCSNKAKGAGGSGHG